MRFRTSSAPCGGSARATSFCTPAEAMQVLPANRHRLIGSRQKGPTRYPTRRLPKEEPGPKSPNWVLSLFEAVVTPRRDLPALPDLTSRATCALNTASLPLCPAHSATRVRRGKRWTAAGPLHPRPILGARRRDRQTSAPARRVVHRSGRFATSPRPVGKGGDVPPSLLTLVRRGHSRVRAPDQSAEAARLP